MYTIGVAAFHITMSGCLGFEFFWLGLARRRFFFWWRWVVAMVVRGARDLAACAPKTRAPQQIADGNGNSRARDDDAGAHHPDFEVALLRVGPPGLVCVLFVCVCVCVLRVNKCKTPRTRAHARAHARTTKRARARAHQTLDTFHSSGSQVRRGSSHSTRSHTASLSVPP